MRVTKRVTTEQVKFALEEEQAVLAHPEPPFVVVPGSGGAQSVPFYDPGQRARFGEKRYHISGPIWRCVVSAKPTRRST